MDRLKPSVPSYGVSTRRILLAVCVHIYISFMVAALNLLPYHRIVIINMDGYGRTLASFLARLGHSIGICELMPSFPVIPRENNKTEIECLVPLTEEELTELSLHSKLPVREAQSKLLDQCSMIMPDLYCLRSNVTPETTLGYLITLLRFGPTLSILITTKGTYVARYVITDQTPSLRPRDHIYGYVTCRTNAVRKVTRSNSPLTTSLPLFDRSLLISSVLLCSVGEHGQLYFEPLGPDHELLPIYSLELPRPLVSMHPFCVPISRDPLLSLILVLMSLR